MLGGGEALLLPKQWHTGFAESLSCVPALNVSGFAEAEQLQALMCAWLDSSDNDTEKTYGTHPQVIKAASKYLPHRHHGR